MHPRATALVFCVLVTGADCAWDSPPHSDFITFGASESVARSTVLQSREMWPSNSADTDIEFEASRFLVPDTDTSAVEATKVPTLSALGASAAAGASSAAGASPPTNGSQ